MQQRARRCDPETPAQFRGNRFEPVEHVREVGLPDVAAVDHAKRQHAVLRKLGDYCVDFGACIDGVQMQALHRQLARERQVIEQLAEVGGQQQFDLALGQRVVRGGEGLLPLRR